MKLFRKIAGYCIAAAQSQENSSVGLTDVNASNGESSFDGILEGGHGNLSKDQLINTLAAYINP